MDAAAPWPQEIVVKPIEEIVTNTYQTTPPQQQHPAQQATAGVTDVRKQRPHKDQAINCPRCNSTNTKFCYYNNYSLSQPRYFCKGCRRYWTEGGSLRNIPVGGGSRKNKRSLISSSSNLTTTTTTNSSSSMSSPPLSPKKNLRVLPPQPGLTSQNPNCTTPSSTTATHDLNLGFPPAFRNTNNPNHNNNMSQFVTNLGNNQNFNIPLPPPSSSSAMELLSGISSSNFMAGLQSPGFSTSGFNVNYPIQEFMRPALSFSLDGGNVIHQEESGSDSGRLLFPFESLKLPVNSGDDKTDNGNGNNDEKENGDNSAGFWTGMLGGGGGSGGVSWRL